jgi:hypothetical protein
VIDRSDLPPPPPPPGEVPPQPTPRDPWKKWLPIAIVSVIVLGGIGVFAGLGNDDSAPADDAATAACKTVDMGPLTGWPDPVTVVRLKATPAGQTMYAWGIEDAVWVATGESPNNAGRIWPVNDQARAYDPFIGAAEDVFDTGYAGAAEEAEGALAGCG